MKRFRNLLLIGIALFSMAFLVGCEKSAQIETTLTLDKNFKGERVMHVELSKEVFAENVAGSMEDVQAIFEANCPKELAYEFAETEGSYTADIHLTFDSEEEYYDKVEAITDFEEPGSITISDSVFCNGIEVREKFESQDLLKWLMNALLEKQFVTAENKSYIFDNSGCVVKYEGETYPSNSSHISVSQMTSTQLRKIQVKTSLDFDGNWNREVAFFVPKASMEAGGDRIKEFLEDGVAEGAKGSWKAYKESGEKGQVYTIKAERIPMETMEKLMQKAFHTKDSTVAQEGGGTNLIRSTEYVKETYDLSEFVSGDDSGNFYIEYIMVTGEKENSEQYSIDNGECSISQRFDTYLQPTGIDLKAKVTGADAYNRTFAFTFQNLQKKEKALLKKQAENLAKDLGKVKIKDKKDTYTLTITVKGDREKVGKLYENILGGEMDAWYVVEHKWMEFSNTFAYVEGVRLAGDFLPREIGQTVDVNYELSFGAGTKIKNKLENAFEKKGNTLYLSGSADSPIIVSVYGSKVNLRGIISTVVLLLGILCLLCFLFLFLKGKKKKAELQSEVENQPEEKNQLETEEKSSEEALPEFCTNCGTKFENEEVMFCVECGKKRGE